MTRDREADRQLRLPADVSDASPPWTTTLTATAEENATSGPSIGSSVVAMLTVALLAGWLLSRKVALALLVLFVALFFLEHRGPPKARTAAAKVRGLQRRFGRRLQTAALGLAWALAVLPTSVWRRRRLKPAAGWSEHSRAVPTFARQFVAAPAAAVSSRSTSHRMLLALGLLTALLFMDLGLGTAAARMRNSGGSDDPRATVAAYDRSPWALSYWSDFKSATEWEFEPFVGWRRPDFASEFINVQDGLRSTWPAEPPVVAAIDVWIFGGSTAWGSGQRDDYTIASQIARMSDADGIPVTVTNYGESGYLLWQEIQMLEAELISGNEADVVIFYDGVNEPSSHGKRVTTSPTHSRVDIFEQRLEASTRHALLTEVRQRSLLVQIARGGRNLFRSSVPGQSQELAMNVPAEQALINMMTIYSEGVQVSQALGERHGFETFHFWQPNIYVKRPIEAETEVWDLLGYATWDDDWYRSVHQGALKRLPAGVIDISDALDSTDEPVMIDPSHTNELGAKLVAERIYAGIEPTLRKLATDAGSTE